MNGRNRDAPKARLGRRRLRGRVGGLSAQRVGVHRADRVAVAGQNHIKTIYIEPGSPRQNGFVESLHGRFRDEFLNREQLWTLTEAPVVIGDYYRCKYNQHRAHSRLAYLSPARFAVQISPFPSPVGGAPSPCRGWTKPEPKTKVIPAPRLTHRVVQKSDSGQSFRDFQQVDGVGFRCLQDIVSQAVVYVEAFCMPSGVVLV